MIFMAQGGPQEHWHTFGFASSINIFGIESKLRYTQHARGQK
jgi:hypothetical protein